MFDEIYTTYAPDTGITFIMKDTYEMMDQATLDGKLVSTAVIGWYYGAPTEENTRMFAGSLIATYE